MEDWVFVGLCNWFDVWLICNLPVFLFQLLCFGEGGKEVIACYYWYWRLSSQSLKRTLASVSEKQRIRFVHLWLIWHVLRLRFFCYDLWITVVFGFFDGGASLCWLVLLKLVLRLMFLDCEGNAGESAVTFARLIFHG